MRGCIALICAGIVLAAAGPAAGATARHVDVVRSLTGTHVWTRTATTWKVAHYDVVGRPLGTRSGKVVAAGPKTATGSGRVFDPNPVVALDNQSLTDQNDADYPALQPAYVTMPLTRLDGSGYLRGAFADVSGTTSPAYSPSLQFAYGRTDERFEQVMAYYAVTKAQEYIQSLGFANVNNEPQRLKADKWGQDNSAYYPNYDTIKFGKGGVDDAEDVEVIWHEYGHAIQDDQVEGYGTTLEAGLDRRGLRRLLGVHDERREQPARPCVHRRLGLDELRRRAAVLPPPRRHEPPLAGERRRRGAPQRAAVVARAL